MKRTRNSVYSINKTPYYKIGDKVEAIKTDIGAWFDADIVDISRESNCSCRRRCTCVYKLLFDRDDTTGIVDRRLNEIRQITYSSLHWEDLKAGMTVVINYNVKQPGTWGYWYDFFIDTVVKREPVVYLQGTLLIGYNGSKGKISLVIDSKNMADVLEIKQHATLEEKEREDFETGFKPVYCEICRNIPIKNCKSCACCLCGVKKDYLITLQCDECGKWYHTYCLEPPLMALPEEDDDWYCPDCNNESQRAKIELESKLKLVKPKVEVEMKPKRKYVRRQSRNGKADFSSGDQVDKRKIRSQFLISESTNIEDITKQISSNNYIWNEIQKFYPKFYIEGTYVSVKEKKSVSNGKNSDDDQKLPLEVEMCITNDVLNKQLWDEAKEYLPKGKKAFLTHVEHLFTCSICCELMKKPITLSCKHSFCISCFFKSLSMNVYNCALCRTDVIKTQHYVVNEDLDTILNILFPSK